MAADRKCPQYAARCFALLALFSLAWEARATCDRNEALSSEPHNAGWILYLDNDAFTPANRDEDYTGGFALTLGGRRAREWAVSLDSPLGAIDRWLAPGDGLCENAQQLHALQVGMIAFVPNMLLQREIIANDRPYASLIFLSSARAYVRAPDQPVYLTQLSIGVLGLDVVPQVQDELHKVFGTYPPRGWDHQISDGGEPTAMYSWTRMDPLHRGARHDFKSSLSAGAGYLTQASAALGFRWGRIATPWWSFNPDSADYISDPSPVVAGAGGLREFYLWGGIKASLRGYNAFLQGQFRDSDLEYAYRDLRPVIGHAWMGLTLQATRNTRFAFALRYQSSELRNEGGDRDPFWGGLMLQRSL